MKALIVPAICMLSWIGSAALADGQRPPEPDYAAIARMAAEVDPQTPYVASMPERHRECGDVAAPYFKSRGTGVAAAGGYILTECHVAMLVKMAELYYRPDAFGAGGMSAVMDRLQDDLSRLYQGIYDGPIRCLQVCGTITRLSAIGAKGSDIERAVETMALLHIPPPDRAQWLEAWNRAGWVK